MNSALNRIRFIAWWLAVLLLPLMTRAAAPMFMMGSSGTDSFPFYGDGSAITKLPVGKTIAVPIVVSGSGPMAYTASSSVPGLQSVIKTGYRVMNVHVTYTGTTGTFSTLHAFTGTDGASPSTGLNIGSGTLLYGVSATGGSNNFGEVYQTTTPGTFAPLYSFTGGADGSSPEGPLATANSTSSTALYGVTEAGGTSSFGTIYTLTTSGSLTTQYTFSGGADGGNPYAGLTFVTGSNEGFFGVTANGGANSAGTIFKITTTGSFSTLYSFTGGNDGANPKTSLTLGSDGNLYGTTIAGGTNSHGAIYEVLLSNSSAPAFRSLYSFSGGTDGASPYGRLAAGSGVLYGTVETGGTSNFGGVYEITNSGTAGGFGFSTIYSFTGGADGGNPFAGAVLASDGNLYGVTETDGTNNFGTIYQLTTSGSIATLYTFTGGSDGGNPYAPLLEGVTGDLFGTTTTGGANSKGTIFQLPLPNAGAFSGTMKFALLRDMAPVACGYIAGFAQSGFYNGLDFFRILNLGDGFVAQGGSSTNDDGGDVGFTFDNEFNPALIFDGAGQLALANGGYDGLFHGSNGSQFFITQSSLREHDYLHTIFGQLLSGFDIMTKVMGVPVQSTTTGLPVQPVTMDSVTVSEDNTDAILLVTGAGYVPHGANINIIATDPSGNKAQAPSQSGTGTTPVLGFAMATGTGEDTVNDPPFIVQDADVNLGLHQRAALPFHTVDLEFDYLFTDVEVLNFTASPGLNGNIATITPSQFDPITSADVGFLAQEAFVSGSTESAVTVGFGLGNMTGYPAELTGTPGGSLAAHSTPLSGPAVLTGSDCAAFLAANPLSSSTEFTPLINWGDGTLTTGSTGASVVKASMPGFFTVVSSTNHTYSNPGIYPVTVTVTASNGGLLHIRSHAVVSSGPIYAVGRTFTAARGLINGLVGSFIDSSGFTSGSYSALISWGDGVIGKGTVRGGGGNFEVYGKHQYTVGTSYPVDVTITSGSNSGDALSDADITGVPAHLPPVAQSHITGEIGSPGFNGDLISEEVTLVNSGNLASGPISLRFYLSPTADVTQISTAAIALSVGGRSTYNVPSIKPGSALEGAVSNIALPGNAVTRGKYIIMQVNTSDPIAIHMDYPHNYADPFPLVE
jgi:uncharacterized repeat protein (TIGR03803 family)